MKDGHIISRACTIAIVLALSTSAHTAVFQLDSLTVVKNGNPMFGDDFGDGNPPPAAPNFGNGNAASYFVRGSIGEADGKMLIDTAGGALSTGSSGIQFRQSLVRLNTNTSNAEENLNRGLKDDDTFEVTALFDLVVPQPLGEHYSLDLTDFTSTNPSSDLLGLRVQRLNNNSLVIRQYYDPDGGGSQFDSLALWGLDTNNDQIAFRFTKPDAASTMIESSWAYVNGGVFSPWVDGVDQAIFNGERFTRVQVQGRTVVPLPAAALLFAGAIVAVATVGRRRA